MALPTSRNTTYTPSVQVKSVDLNALQDQIVAAHQRYGTAIGEWPEARFDEAWRINTSASAVDTTTTDGSTDPEGWFADCTTGTRQYKPPTSTLRTRHVELVVSSGHTVVLTSEQFLALHADVVFAWEWVVETGTIATASTLTVMTVENGGAGGGTGFAANSGSANWMTRLSNVDTATAVAVANNTVYRFRVEIVGDNKHAGSNYLINWYINGVLVRTTTDSLAGMTSPLRKHFRFQATAGGPFQLRVGLSRAAWNF